MSDLKLIQDIVSGKIHIKENSQYNNICAEHVVINPHVTVRLYGSIKNIVLHKGSRIYLHGVISGSVENKGGEIHVFKG